jgi:hypothetical protein
VYILTFSGNERFPGTAGNLVAGAYRAAVPIVRLISHPSDLIRRTRGRRLPPFAHRQATNVNAQLMPFQSLRISRWRMSGGSGNTFALSGKKLPLFQPNTLRSCRKGLHQQIR